MRLPVYEPLDDAELDEIERYTNEALSYRHPPEFVYECARLVAEVKRLREAQERKRWSLTWLSDLFAPPRWLGGGRVAEAAAAVTAPAAAVTERQPQWN